MTIKINKLIVDEGITYLGRCSLYITFDDLVLPSTLTELHNNIGDLQGGGSVTAYKDGKQVTVVVDKRTSAEDFLTENFGIKIK